MRDLSCLLEENGSCPCGNGHRLDLKMIKNVNGYNRQIQYYSVRLFSLVVERALFSVLLLIFMVVLLIFMVVLLIFMVVLLILRIFMILHGEHRIYGDLH